MSKEQAELEVGSPAVSPVYGKQDLYPTAYNLETPEYFEYAKQKIATRRNYRPNKTTLVLSVALLLCGAGAAVASYFAVEFRDRAQKCGLQPIMPVKANPSQSLPLIPTSSCSTFNSSYTSAVNSATFTLWCGTWYRGNDLLGVYVYTFEACMDACASFNSYDYMHNATRCYSVTYDAVKKNTGNGNCWLKARPNLTATMRNVTDSAVLE